MDDFQKIYREKKFKGISIEYIGTKIIVCMDYANGMYNRIVKHGPPYLIGTIKQVIDKIGDIYVILYNQKRSIRIDYVYAIALYLGTEATQEEVVNFCGLCKMTLYRYLKKIGLKKTINIELNFRTIIKIIKEECQDMKKESVSEYIKEARDIFDKLKKLNIKVKAKTVVMLTYHNLLGTKISKKCKIINELLSSGKKEDNNEFNELFDEMRI